MNSGAHATSKAKGIVRTFIEFLAWVLLVLVMFFLLTNFVFCGYVIPSGSMEDTLMPEDRIFAEKISYYVDSPQPGDIVTFDDPEVPGRTLIKRCVAVAGQTVDLQDGKVVVDGVTLSEPYTMGKESLPLNSPTVTYPYTVPQGHIWVMGDNRTNSLDSRYFGSIRIDSVTGKAFFRFFPFDRIGTL